MFSIGITNINSQININIYHPYELESKDKKELEQYNIKYHNLDLFACFTILLQFIKSHGINTVNSNFFNKEGHTEKTVKYMNKLSEILNPKTFQNNQQTNKCIRCGKYQTSDTHSDGNCSEYCDSDGHIICYF